MQWIYRVASLVIALVIFNQIQGVLIPATDCLNELIEEYDYYDVAINTRGQALAVFGGELFGSFDVKVGEWKFVTFDEISTKYCMKKELVDTDKLQETDLSFKLGLSIETNRVTKTIVINETGVGYAIFKVPYGVDTGKIACASYQKGYWGRLTILSDQEGSMPSLVQSSDGRAVALWVTGVSGDLHVMGAYYSKDEWHFYGSLQPFSTVKNIEIKDLKIKMDDEGNIVVLWIASSQDKRLVTTLVGCYLNLDGELWCLDDICLADFVSAFDVVFNNIGDVFVVWSSVEGIQLACFDDSLWEWKSWSVIKGNNLEVVKVMTYGQDKLHLLWVDGSCQLNHSHYDLASQKEVLRQSILNAEIIYSLEVALLDNGDLLGICHGELAGEEVLLEFYYDKTTSIWSRNFIAEKGLLDNLQAVSIASKNYGLVIWYDFLSNQFYQTKLIQTQPALGRKDHYRRVNQPDHNRLLDSCNLKSVQEKIQSKQNIRRRILQN